MIDNLEPRPIPWFLPEVGQTEENFVREVFASNYLNEGEVTTRFESEVARIVGVRHCVATTSGTTAIALALMGLGIGQGDEVIVPDLTFIATANAVRLAGAEVHLVDIEPSRFAIDVDKLANSIRPETKAIVSVDVNGRAARYEALETICHNHGLALVCDATEGLGSKYHGKPLGSFGDAGCFSFSAAKTITTGQGGMIATNNTDLYHRLLELKDQGRRTRGTGGNDLHPVMGYNFKYTNLQAAVGLAQLQRLPKRLEHFRQRDTWYAELLSNTAGIELPPICFEDGEVCQWRDALVRRREVLEASLSKAGIGHRPFWYPLHRQQPYADEDARFRIAMAVSRRGLWLPSYFGLTFAEVERICDTIHAALHA